MAEVTKTGVPSLATAVPPNSSRVGSGLKTGEAIAAGDVCYIKSDGLVWKSTGAAANVAAKARGMALVASSVGEAVTLYRDVDVRFATTLAPGTDLFLSGTVVGGLADAASVGGTAPIAFVIDATRIRFLGN